LVVDIDRLQNKNSDADDVINYHTNSAATYYKDKLRPPSQWHWLHCRHVTQIFHTKHLCSICCMSVSYLWTSVYLDNLLTSLTISTTLFYISSIVSQFAMLLYPWLCMSAC